MKRRAWRLTFAPAILATLAGIGPEAMTTLHADNGAGAFAIADANLPPMAGPAARRGTQEH